MALKSNNIFVVGHKNPDTDSICSAICYANLKNKNENTDRYIPVRAGHISDETAYVLERFGAQRPVFMDDVSTKLSDIEINPVKGVSKDISIRDAWDIMRQNNIQTLPVVSEDGTFEGLITVLDIAAPYMERMNRDLMAEARTHIGSIARTIGGTILLGNGDDYFENGKVLIAAADEEYLSRKIEPGDMVISGSWEKIQLCAINCGAKVLIVCTEPMVSERVQELAKEKGTTIICVERDTYTTASLVGQSMPISHFMVKDNLVTFRYDEWTETVRDVMAQKRFKYFPVLDKKGRYIGLVSKRNVIQCERRKLILVDHNERSQAIDGASTAEVVEIIDHHKIGSMETLAPIYFRNQPVGCTATIITEMYEENRISITPQIAGLLLSAILSDTLLFRSPTCTLTDQKVAEKLSRIAGVDPTSLAMDMFKAGSNFANKAIGEIFFADFKKFTTADVNYGAGQVNILTTDDAAALKPRVIEYLKNDFKMDGLDMVFFLITNIMDESSELIFYGPKAETIVREAFDKEPEGNSIYLPGVVSRKKQLLPPLMAAIQGN